MTYSTLFISLSFVRSFVPPFDLSHVLLDRYFSVEWPNTALKIFSLVLHARTHRQTLIHTQTRAPSYCTRNANTIVNVVFLRVPMCGLSCAVVVLVLVQLGLECSLHRAVQLFLLFILFSLCFVVQRCVCVCICVSLLLIASTVTVVYLFG